MSRPGRLARPASEDEILALLADVGPRGALVRGLGRSYGDAAQNAGGLVVDLTELERPVRVDPELALADASGGTSLAEVIDAALPQGFFLPVTPGTKFVTVGGAVAADVHGKSHHVDGTFSQHVSSFDLLTGTGELLTATPGENGDAFWATAGGLGLTGILLSARLRLLPVETAWIVVDTERVPDVGAALDLFSSSDDAYRYSVAWIDCLARGRSLGRSVLIRGNHATVADLPLRARRRPLARPRRVALAAPPWAPSGVVNRWTVAAFNEAYFRAAREGIRVTPLEPFFYPLDAVSSWNRLYGRRGFVQYQCVVPIGAEDALLEALERLSSSGCPATLAVLKRFGDEVGLISFPLRGWTLAVDIPAGFPGLARLLDGLDELVASRGGRIYLAKDARLRPDLVEAMYPRLRDWRRIRARLDPNRVFVSDLARRLGLVER